MSDNKKSAKPPKTSDPKIDAIKDIIFGDTISEIQEEFDQVKTSIREHRQALDEQMSQVRQELEKTIQQLQQETTQKLQDIKEDTLQRFGQMEGNVPSNADLGKMFEDLGKRLQKGRNENS